MHLPSSPVRRAATTLMVVGTALAATALLSGCGRSETPARSAKTPASSATASVSNEPDRAGPDDLATTTTSSALPVPSDGPTGLASFPVPPGAKVKAPGAQEKSWQFDILTPDVDKVLAFYRTSLPDAGFTTRTDVEKNVGIETITYDIMFTSATAEGYVIADRDHQDVFVLVQSHPQK